MDLPDNSLPQSSNTVSLAARILKNKDLILLALILIISALAITIFVTKPDLKNALNKSKDAGTIVTTQATCLDGSTSNRVCDDLGNCYNSCPNQGAQNITTGNQVTPVQPTVRQKSLSEINAEAIANPGQTFCTTTSGGTQTCVVSDGTTTYSPSAYNNAYPPTATPAPTTKPSTNTGTGSSGSSGTGGQTALANTPTPTPMGFTSNISYPTASPTPMGFESPTAEALKNCAQYNGSDYQTCLAIHASAQATKKALSPTSTPKATITPASCTTGSNGAIICSGESNASSLSLDPATPQTQNEMRAAFTAYVKSIGSDAALGQNPTPIGTQVLTVQLYNLNNQVVKEEAGPITAKALAGKTPTNMGYAGQISLGTTLSAGSYKAKIRLDNTLWKAANITLTPGVLATLPVMELVLGDLDQDNTIGLLDYNILLSCYGSKQCAEKAQADLNLDGKIDELDLNILYDSFRTREGD